MPEFGRATEVFGGVTFTLALDAEDAGDNIVVTWTLTRGDDAPVSGQFTFNTNLTVNNQAFMSFHPGIPLPGPRELCLIECIGKALVVPALECLIKHWGNKKAIFDCFKEKGIPTAGHALICAYDCYVKHPH
jgi:hypothetical protein